MLNKNHFVALHVFDVHNVFFCHLQSRLFIKFDAALMLLITVYHCSTVPPHVGNVQKKGKLTKRNKSFLLILCP